MDVLLLLRFNYRDYRVTLDCIELSVKFIVFIVMYEIPLCIAERAQRARPRRQPELERPPCALKD